MALSITYFIIGLVLLILAADRFVAGAAALAKNIGIPSMIIGLTIVALGTSLPEIVVAIISSVKGEPTLAIGSAIGSNIANVGFVLAIAAIVAPLRVEAITLRREYPILLFVTILSAVLLFDGYLSRSDGIILLVLLIILLTLTTWYARYHQREFAKTADNSVISKMSTQRAIIWLIIGGTIIPLSSELLINGAIGIATFFGVSSFVIGISVVAIGTSLPELATSVVSVIKGEHDISIGNIIGSNVFNLLAVLPFPGIIAPTYINPRFKTFDLPALLISTLAIFVVAYSVRGPGRITRFEGIMLLLLYSLFIYLSFAFK